MSFLKDRIKSFGYAINGLVWLFRNEGNAKVHMIATVLVVAAGFIFEISAMEWVAILLCIGGVISAEGINTAIEKLCDKVSPEKDNLIKIAKDVSAGSVLILAIISVIVAILIFIPKFSQKFI